jgi:hypothetical protein
MSSDLGVLVPDLAAERSCLDAIDGGKRDGDEPHGRCVLRSPRWTL